MGEGERDVCQRCGVPGVDRRTLWMACFYAMNELHLPFVEKCIYGVLAKATGRNKWGSTDWDKPWDDGEKKHHWPMFTLRVCKRCRGDWMRAIQAWFRAKPSIEDPCDEAGEPLDVGPMLEKAETLRAELVALLTDADATIQALHAVEAQQMPGQREDPSDA